ncbi:hypothetical protein MACJ_002518 [Theileria orientalis]|uniref:AP2/ERF domain-containing protein n=1 Tax=Theileria orientalis TaxID=68886 RepID=A0A976M6C5_THEOR|nr:hypothetical protein MACJ_002518 [Theileria orientalis]
MIRAVSRIVATRLKNPLNIKSNQNLLFKYNLCTSSSSFIASKQYSLAAGDPYNVNKVMSSYRTNLGLNVRENYIYSQKCHFAGRQRGLKRRKHKKETRRIQTSLGRRLELFYPKKAKKVRIRLVQNSRGNLIYDPVQKKFYVFYYKQGTQVFRSFRASGGKFEIAKAKAVNFARQMGDFYNKKLLQIQSKYKTYYLDNIKGDCETINYNLKLQPDCNLSGVRGVFFDGKKSSWVVAYNEHGVRKYKFFDLNELGFQNSYTEALDFLRFQLFKNHKFLHRRHRTRKNRPILKC